MIKVASSFLRYGWLLSVVVATVLRLFQVSLDNPADDDTRAAIMRQEGLWQPLRQEGLWQPLLLDVDNNKSIRSNNDSSNRSSTNDNEDNNHHHDDDDDVKNILYPNNGADVGVLSQKPIHFFRQLQQQIDDADPVERCHRYGFRYNNNNNNNNNNKPPTSFRRRIFYGALIASEPWELLEIVAAESYQIFSGMVFVESNRTQMFAKRPLYWYQHKEENNNTETDNNSNNKTTPTRVETALQQLFGVDRVQVRLYVNEYSRVQGLEREHKQRAEILKGWKHLGMRRGDVGYLGDADEMFARDFLRAVQTCDNIAGLDYARHECRNVGRPMGLRGYTQMYETSPDCVAANRVWYAPSMMNAECLEEIVMDDNDSLHHPKAPRQGHPRVPQRGGVWRERGYGWADNYDKLLYPDGNKKKTKWPLFSAGDVRRIGASHQVRINNNNNNNNNNQQSAAAKSNNNNNSTASTVVAAVFNPYTAFHFHNWFPNSDTLRFKYYTFGHAKRDTYNRSLVNLAKSLEFVSRCVHNRRDDDLVHHRVTGGFEALPAGGNRPIYFHDADYRQRRHAMIQTMVHKDDEKYQQQ